MTLREELEGIASELDYGLAGQGPAHYARGAIMGMVEQLRRLATRFDEAEKPAEPAPAPAPLAEALVPLRDLASAWEACGATTTLNANACGRYLREAINRLADRLAESVPGGAEEGAFTRALRLLQQYRDEYGFVLVDADDANRSLLFRACQAMDAAWERMRDAYVDSPLPHEAPAPPAPAPSQSGKHLMEAEGSDDDEPRWKASELTDAMRTIAREAAREEVAKLGLDEQAVRKIAGEEIALTLARLIRPAPEEHVAPDTAGFTRRKP